MPTYEYEILDNDGKPTGERFEAHQPMSDDPLTKHPETGKPCRRAIVAPAIAGSMSPLKSKGMLSDKNLSRLGISKYQNVGDGRLERRAGDGPESINAG